MQKIKSNVMHKPLARKAEIVFISSHKIRFSNTDFNSDTLMNLTTNFDWELFQALPAWEQKDGTFLLTDGNHRCVVAITRGEKWIPCVLLKKKEYEYIKYSERTIDLDVFLPKYPLYIL